MSGDNHAGTRGNPGIARLKNAVRLKTEGKTLEEIGKILGGLSRQRVWQMMNEAIDFCIISKEEYKNSRICYAPLRNFVEKNSRAYFSDIASSIESLDRKLFESIRDRYGYTDSQCRQAEKYCLNALVENGSITKTEMADMQWLIERLRINQLPISSLKVACDEYINTTASLDEIALKYGMCPKKEYHPALYADKQMRFAMRMGIINLKKYNEKTKSNMRHIGRKMNLRGKHYSENVMRQVIQMHDSGMSYPAIEHKLHIPYNYSRSLYKRALKLYSAKAN
jgi:hypothetical protein